MKMLFYIQFFLSLSLLATCKSKQVNFADEKFSIELDSIAFSEEDTIPYLDIVEGEQIKETKPILQDGLKVNSPKQIDKRLNKIQKNGDLVIKKVNNSNISTSNIEGKVVYQIPNEMKVRETYQVLLRIGKSSINIYENLNGLVKETIIPITQTMEVKLIDPSPNDSKIFEIVPDNQAIQLVDSTGVYTQWTWNVTPVKAAKTNLKIVVSIIRDGNKKETVYEDNVQIKINPIKQFSFWFSKYWQWLFTTLLLPLFKWLYDKYVKNRKI